MAPAGLWHHPALKIMLSPEEQKQVQHSLSAVADQASRGLQAADTPWQAIHFIGTLHKAIDEVMGTASTGELAPACAPGCSHCCNLLVEITDTEALRLARHVQALDDHARAARLQRLQSHAKTTPAPGQGGRHAEACAFLDGGLCTVYDIRPASCRKAHSLSAQACASQGAELPLNLGLALQSEVLVAGTLQAYTRRGLPARRYPLSLAVLAALDQPQAAQAWYEGQPLIPPQTVGS